MSVLLKKIAGKMILYNLEDQTSREMMVHGLPPLFNADFTFVQSLVSPKRRNNLFSNQAVHGLEVNKMSL